MACFKVTVEAVLIRTESLNAMSYIFYFFARWGKTGFKMLHQINEKEKYIWEKKKII